MPTPVLIKKHLIRPYLKDGSDWVQIKKATEFVRTMNPSIEEREYIADEFATSELMSYKPAESLSITTYKGEPDFDLFYKLYKARAIGADAQRDFMIVSVFDSATKTIATEEKTVYYAEKTSATVSVNELNASGSSISVDVNENGTPVIGYVYFDDDGKPVFTEGSMAD